MRSLFYFVDVVVWATMDEDMFEFICSSPSDWLYTDEMSFDRPNNANSQAPLHASPAQGPGPVLPPPSGRFHLRPTRVFTMLMLSQAQDITPQTPRLPTTRVSPHCPALQLSRHTRHLTSPHSDLLHQRRERKAIKDPKVLHTRCPAYRKLSNSNSSSICRLRSPRTRTESESCASARPGKER